MGIQIAERWEMQTPAERSANIIASADPSGRGLGCRESVVKRGTREKKGSAEWVVPCFFKMIKSLLGAPL